MMRLEHTCFLAHYQTVGTLVVSLGNSASEGKAMLAMARNSLFNEEIRKNDFLGNDTHALVTENRSHSKSRGPFGHNKSCSYFLVKITIILRKKCKYMK